MNWQGAPMPNRNYASLSGRTELWLWIANQLEKQGQPVLLAILLAIITVPISEIRIFQDFYVKLFEGEIPNWHKFATGVFIASLCTALLIQMKARTSWRGFKKSARALSKLVDEGVIEEESRKTALQWLFANVILHHLGGDPKRVQDVEQLTKQYSFRKLLDELRPSDGR